MELFARTRDALDWAVVVEALAEGARTAMGVRAVHGLEPLTAPPQVTRCYDAIDELTVLYDTDWRMPIGGVGDIGGDVRRAAKGEVLERDELRQVATTMMALADLHDGLCDEAEAYPVLASMAYSITVDEDLVDELDQAFDAHGQLSAERYPELGELRGRIADLAARARAKLEELLASDALADVLQDSYVALRGDRYVLPIKEHAKRWDIGMVHDTSGSGRTVFIEPHEVMELSNRRRVAQGQLRAAERRILGELSAWVGRDSAATLESLDAATQIDLAVARHALAMRLEATRPIVGHEGRVSVKAARHPVLVLRGVDVVANDLAVGGDLAALVLTGPNTGGKTVALKTIGLCALLVRAGCFVPAAAESRVDLFDAVFADIGDAQTVGGDLSTFSAHLVALRAMLAQARPRALLLLDELCTGTDPSQGAALGRAVIEGMLDSGATTVITTHYASLKALALGDERVAMAAVEYRDGQPTYRVVRDATGESHAFDTALRMGLSPALVERARSLLAGAEGALADALGALDAQREQIDEARAEVERREEALASREARIQDREARLAERTERLENEGAAEFKKRLERADKAIGAVVAELQRAPSHDGVAAARATLGAFRALAPDEPAPTPAAAEVRSFEVGDPVVHGSLGKGEVVSVGDSIMIRVGALTVQAKPEDLAPGRPQKPTRPRGAASVAAAAAPPEPELAEALRIPSNTLDLRGKRVLDGLDEVDGFLDGALVARMPVVFILHGHGTGAMKAAVREHLRTHEFVRRSRPANADQGGDAYTVVAVKM